MDKRTVRFEVSSREVLDRLAAAPLPLGLREAASETRFLRIVYYDTQSKDLEQRNATVRLQIEEGRQTLAVEVRDNIGKTSDFSWRRASSDVGARPTEEVLDGDSEAAQLLRALIDPARLHPAFELEITRRIRNAKADQQNNVVFAYDAITVRRGDSNGELFELEVTLPELRDPRFEGLVQAIESEAGIRLTLAETIARARDLLNDLEIDQLQAAVRGAREVAVIPYHHGRVALVAQDRRLRIPSGPGSGHDACRRVLSSVFGRSYGRLRHLGTSAGSESRPALEVWVAEDVARVSAGLVWERVEDLLAMAGAPPLREARTLAALHALARSDLAARAAVRSTRGLVSEEDEDAEPATLFELTLSRTNGKHPAIQDEARELAPELLLNPEMSRLLFDERILSIVEDPATPLLERVRFLSMFWSRLDDFFMTRIAEFKDQVAEGATEKTLDGLTPVEQLELARLRAGQIAARAYDDLTEQLMPELAHNGIHVLRWKELVESDREYLIQTYASRIEAAITPVIADPTHPFPRIRNLRPAIAALVRLPESTQTHFVAVQFPGELPRFLPLAEGIRFVPLEELILALLPRLYRGLEVVQAHTFRVTRAGNIEFEQEGSVEVIATVANELAKRPFGEVVRLEVESTMPLSMRDRILHELQFERPDSITRLGHADVFPVRWLVDLVALKEIVAVKRPDLHFPPLEHAVPLDPDRSIFDQLREREHLVRFPHDSFDATVERLIVDAAADPDVSAIKITLYRTDAHSRIVKALAAARAAGKDAFALVELKASFDEARNIEWARSLESSGVHVVYSPVNFKVHAKTALVLRREGGILRRYAYIGTGNLNASTARGYTDVGILTADQELTEEVNTVFNVLTGYSAGADFRHLLVSPFNMRERMVEMLDREIEHQKAGRGGYVRIQMNGLADRRMIHALYRAAAAGVRIEMAVREICCLRPGIPGVSESVSVVSLLGRFLQHSRIFRFENAGNPEYYIGSADWRPRNLSKRVEVVTPVRDPQHRRLLDQELDNVLKNPDAWTLQPDGSYSRNNEVVGPMRMEPVAANG